MSGGGLRNWARALKRDVGALWLAARDPRLPLLAKLVAGLTAAYALSPIDLIPDFIPVLGLLDDLLLVPLGIWLAIRLIPADVFAELRGRAEAMKFAPSRAGVLIVALIWIGAAIALWWWLGRPGWANLKRT